MGWNYPVVGELLKGIVCIVPKTWSTLYAGLAHLRLEQISCQPGADWVLIYDLIL